MLVTLGAIANAAEPIPVTPKADKWEKDLAAFDANDAKSPPPKDAILFVGSSSIRLWKLDKSFPEMKTINRGFGGSLLSDSARYSKRLVTAHQPRVVVVYAGDNDLHAKRTPEQVLAALKEFVTNDRADLPQAKIVYIGIKPSIARWKNIENVRKANRLLSEYIAEQKSNRLVFIDIEPAMLGEDGTPRPELLVKDGLHMSDAGYEVVTKLVMPHLQEAIAKGP